MNLPTLLEVYVREVHLNYILKKLEFEIYEFFQFNMYEYSTCILRLEGVLNWCLKP